MTYLRVALGTLGIGAFPLLALGYQSRIVGSLTYAALAVTAILLLALAILWPPRSPTRRELRTVPRRRPTQGEHHA
ncbi:MAG: hypothetical protein HOO96_44275 [Polyangiaceae bacterium]|nr:hypothetical protein [Polyangiaceae bacterium]